MLIAMAVFSTLENNRLQYTKRTLESLERTVDWDKHRLIIVDNGSCEEMHRVYEEFTFPSEIIYFEENKGTAVAINTAWKQRAVWEHAVKLDDDVEIHESNWIELMELVFQKDEKVGICGLKRTDLEEWPLTDNTWFISKVYPLPHERGERWLIVEEVNHVMGTAQAYRAELLDRIGYLYQMQDLGNLYGLDDSFAAIRCQVAGFKNVFIPAVHIDHIDPGGTEYTKWKQDNALKWLPMFNKIKKEYISGERDIYYNGGFESGSA